MRRTKIVATIGPSSDSLDALNALVTAGVDVFRLSFAHGDIPSCIERLRRVRTAAPRAAIVENLAEVLKRKLPAAPQTAHQTAHQAVQPTA